MEWLRMPNQTWSIVSVADDGGQIRAFIQRWLGYPKPKPYCAFAGGWSLFQHTMDRAARLCQPERIVTVINVLLEGMAAGLPIITTSSGGSPEVVIHGTNGLVVPPGDPDALAGALSDLLTDSEARDRFSRNNREKALKDLSLER